MTQLHDLRLLVQQESERIAESQPDELDLSVVQARTVCWLALLAEAHEEQASDAERRGDVEQAIGWFADAMRLRDEAPRNSPGQAGASDRLEDRSLVLNSSGWGSGGGVRCVLRCIPH
jgi:hypothetical protein